MNDIICFIYKWQPLIGAVIGGVFALFVALVVAYKSRRYEQSVSAILLIPDLLQLHISQDKIEEYAETYNIPEDNRDHWMASHLIEFRPKLSPLYEVSMSRVMPIHPALAAHLNFVIKFYNSVEERLKKLEENMQNYKKTGHYLIDNEQFIFLIKIIREDMRKISKHSICANNLLDKLVICKLSFIYRILYSFRKPFGIGECGELLKTGIA